MMLVVGLVIGCRSDDARIAEMAQRQADREADQVRQMTQLQQQVAEGSRHLVEADAETRKELTELQRDLRSDQATVGQQRDSLEVERRQIAAERRWDSMVGPAITGAAILIACVLPLVVCACSCGLYIVSSRRMRSCRRSSWRSLVSERPRFLPPSPSGIDGPHTQPGPTHGYET